MIKMAILQKKEKKKKYNFCQCSNSKFRDYIVEMKVEVPTNKIKIDQGSPIHFALHLNFSLIWLTEELGVPRDITGIRSIWHTQKI